MTKFEFQNENGYSVFTFHFPFSVEIKLTTDALTAVQFSLCDANDTWRWCQRRN